jgi:hypothetical protein
MSLLARSTSVALAMRALAAFNDNAVDQAIAAILAPP